MTMKRWMRRALRNVGWELTRFRPESSEWARLVSMLTLHGVQTVFDVGANIGQYAKNLRDAGFAGRIVSFEPTSKAHAQLCSAARCDPLWTVAERMALGNWDGETRIHVTRNSVSSSLLPMLELHHVAEPTSGLVDIETVPIARLDSIAPKFLTDDQPVFVKIDVQGFEKNVLEGASNLLERAGGLQVELSLLPLYRGETLFEPMLEYLRNLNFEVWSLNPVFFDRRTGRLLQTDVILFKTRAGSEVSFNKARATESSRVAMTRG